MTDDIRAELTLQRDYLRHALEIVTPIYDHLKTVSVTSNDDKIMLLSELARLQGYLKGGLEMVEQRIGPELQHQVAAMKPPAPPKRSPGKPDKIWKGW